MSKQYGSNAMETNSLVVFVEPNRAMWDSIAAQDKEQGKPRKPKDYGNVLLLSDSGNNLGFSPTSDPMRPHRYAIFVSFESVTGRLKRVYKAAEDMSCEIFEIICCRGTTVTAAAAEIQNLLQPELDFQICCVPMQTIDEI